MLWGGASLSWAAWRKPEQGEQERCGGVSLRNVERDGSPDWIYRLLIRVREMPAAWSNQGPLRKSDQGSGWDPGGSERKPCQARTDDAPTSSDIQPIRPSCCSLPTHIPLSLSLSLQDVRRNQAARFAHTPGFPRRSHFQRVGLSSFSFLPTNSARTYPPSLLPSLLQLALPTLRNLLPVHPQEPAHPSLLPPPPLNPRLARHSLRLLLPLLPPPSRPPLHRPTRPRRPPLGLYPYPGRVRLPDQPSPKKIRIGRHARRDL